MQVRGSVKTKLPPPSSTSRSRWMTGSNYIQITSDAQSGGLHHRSLAYLRGLPFAAPFDRERASRTWAPATTRRGPCHHWAAWARRRRCQAPPRALRMHARAPWHAAASSISSSAAAQHQQHQRRHQRRPKKPKSAGRCLGRGRRPSRRRRRSQRPCRHVLQPRASSFDSPHGGSGAPV